MPKTVIVSIIYEEPEWKRTDRAIRQCGAPVVRVDRKGVGSLAHAYNTGFKAAKQFYKFDYIWFVSNPIFQPGILIDLEEAMDTTKFAAIHPFFNSDHKHMRSDGTGKIRPVPFIEFTAPIVRRTIFEKFKLDEKMPYWGHDLDWGYRVNQAGHKIAVHNGVGVRHEYIRHSAKRKQHPITKERHERRIATNAETLTRIQELYGRGNTWRQKLGYE